MSFKSWQSYMHFALSVKSKSRYILDEDCMEFLGAIKDTCPSRAKILAKDTILWRAQKGCDYRAYYEGEAYIDDRPEPYSPQRMSPLTDSASEGRANSKGIPCLYVATNKETAMSEVRPWVGSLLSAGQFKVQEELTIIDFTERHGEQPFFYFSNPSEEEILSSVWAHMDNAFSEPVTNSDLKSEYAPTQIIAELIRTLGYDGIAFKSSLGTGYNIALFDLNSAKLVNCALYEAKSVEFSFSQIDNPYFVSN